MKKQFYVRDRNNVIVGWFTNSNEAEGFITRNDPQGYKGFYKTNK